MRDFLSKEERSERMARIRSKDTKLEVLFFVTVGSAIHKAGYRYRKYAESLPGKPDMIFPRFRLAVFVDSSFWHGRNLKSWEWKLKGRYWKQKIKKNVARDLLVNRALKSRGWTVIRIWDTQIVKRPSYCIGRILERLTALETSN